MALDFAFRLPRLLKTRVSNFIANSKARTGAPRPAMDRIIYNLPDSPWKETLVTVGLSAIIYCSWAFLLRGKELPPVDFNIPLPEQCDPDFAEAIQYPFQLRALGDEESGEPKPWEVVVGQGAQRLNIGLTNFRTRTEIISIAGAPQMDDGLDFGSNPKIPTP